MTKPILILVGTMSGNAEMTAEEVMLALKEEGCDVRTLRMEKAGLADFSGDAVILVCTSTYGKGDPPDNAKPLFNALETERPDLSMVQYAVIGLGDSTHVGTFCFGGKKFDELLAALGAKRLAERCEHDAASSCLPEDVALAWLPSFVEAVRRKADD